MNETSGVVVRWTVTTLLAWCFGFAPLPLPGQEAVADRDSAVTDLSPHSAAALIAETRSIRPGASFTVGLHLTLEPDWHTYWKNPGDSGEPASITWRLPPGFTAGEIQWPVPQLISFPPLASYGYFEEVLLLVEIALPPDVADGDSVRLAGRADWLVCIEDCFPAEAGLDLTLPVSDALPVPDPVTAPAFEAARAQLPAVNPEWSGFARFKEPWYGLKLDPPDRPASDLAAGLPDVHFFASEPNVIDHAAEQRPDWDGETLVIRLARSGFSSGVPDTVRGVLVTARDEGGAATAALEIAVPVIVAGTPSGASETGLGVGIALLFAFLGGLLLNLMPCVFPVLSLKVLGFVEHAEQEQGGAARQGAAFATGVLVSFWVLGALLLALRAAGENVGWGFQLQAPLFVGTMAVLFFLLALALLGAFEIGMLFTRFGAGEFVKVPSRTRFPRNATTRSFASGVIATVVATPCTAPFMGAALGWALLRPPAETMLVFTALGAGMAAPYLALSLTPGLVERLPPPGRWMETLKQLLAFPLLATVVWLAWVFGLQTGVNGITGLLGALLLVGLAVWMGTRWGGISARQPWKSIARVAAIAIGCIALLVLARAAGSVPVSERESSAAAGGQLTTADWPVWSPAVAEEMRRDGRPYLIDFTAAWCLSCQVNERVVLNTATVRDAFREHGVRTLRADWTRRDAEITAALAELGRSSVPVYALYSGGSRDPVLLPSVLTKEIVLDALETHVPVQR